MKEKESVEVFELRPFITAHQLYLEAKAYKESFEDKKELRRFLFTDVEEE